MDAAHQSDQALGGHDHQDERRRIGEIFVELGLVTPGELEEALEKQRGTGGRIGEILVEQGSMSRLDLASALSEYWEPQRYSSGRSKTVSLFGAGPVAPAEPEAAPAESAALEQRIVSLERALEELARSRSADALALGVRLAGLEAAVAELHARLG